MSVAMKCAVQQDVWAGDPGACHEIEQVVSAPAAAIEENLGAVDSEIGRLRGALRRDTVLNADICDGYPFRFGADGYAVDRVLDRDILQPGILGSVDANRLVMRLRDGYRLGRRDDPKVLHTDVGDTAGYDRFDHRDR